MLTPCGGPGHAGDLNIYNDHYSPIDLLSNGHSTGCGGDAATDQEDTLRLRDSWLAAYPDQAASGPGLTFSNMPSPGMNSRPDMVLAGEVTPASRPATQEPVRSIGCKVLGDGAKYTHRRFNSVILRRAAAVLFHEPEDDHLQGRFSHRMGPGGGHDHSCFHDCGPSGVCACGVCVQNEVAARLADEPVRHRFEAAVKGGESTAEDLEKVSGILITIYGHLTLDSTPAYR